MQFCIIGLGRLGYQVATGLAENGMEVLAIDANESIVSSIRDRVTQAICMQVKDEESLRSIGVDEVDTVIVAMGENFAQSILVTALLKKKLHVKRVIARAISSIHKDILEVVGADRVILPEQEVGVRLADTLSSPFMDLTRLTDSFCISQIRAPKSFIGKEIASLDLFINYNAHCIGIKDAAGKLMLLSPTYVINENDKLIFAGSTDDLEKITKL